MTWYSDSFPDFTLCFEETALVWIPSLVLMVLSFIELPLFMNEKNNEKVLPFTIFSVTKTVRQLMRQLIAIFSNINYHQSLALVLAFLSLAELVIKIVNPSDGYQSLFVAENFTPLIKFCTFVSNP